MTKKILIIISIIIIILIAAIYFFDILNTGQEKKIELLEQKISLLKKENVPLRFKITKREENTITLVTKFYDAQDNVVKRITQEIEGNELHFDFLIFKVKDQNLIFPYKIYTDLIAPDDGIIITDHYTVDEFPQIFFYQGIDNELKEIMIEIFEKIKSNNYDSKDNYFGSAVHDVPEFKSFETNKIYSIVTRTKGGIEIIEN